MKDPAPLFTDTYDLTSWLLGRLHADPSRLAADLCRLALELLDAITAALRRRDDIESLDDADGLLASLRLRLAAEIGLLEERQEKGQIPLF